MLRNFVSEMQYHHLGEAGLVLFCLAFALICYGMLRLSSRASERFASIPLSDRVEDPRDEHP